METPPSLGPSLAAFWTWLAVAAGLGVAEWLGGGRLLIRWALAAATTAALAWALPGMRFATEVAAFAGLALGLSAGRLAVRIGPRRRPWAHLVGRQARVIRFDFHEGLVEVAGERWPARLDETRRTPATGEHMVVTAGDGIVLWVRPER
jgi:membrane protein implicated in regulation of membrane protease activity